MRLAPLALRAGDRELRRKRFIQRIPHTQRYELTSHGRRLAVFLTKTYTRIVNPHATPVGADPPARNKVLASKPVAHPRRCRALDRQHGREISQALRAPRGQLDQCPVLRERHILSKPGQRARRHRDQHPARAERSINQLIILPAV